MFRLLELADESILPSGPSLVIFGKRWVICEYDQLSDAPPYTCLSYAWGKNKVQHIVGQGQVMSSRTVPSFEAALVSSQSQENWAKNITFSHKGATKEEEASQIAALRASQAFWIDALCVPFDDPARATCLQEMGKIFSAAHQVIVVLSEQCSSVMNDIRRSDKIEIASLLCLENEEWVSRAWTYQEAVNSRALYFTVEGDGSVLVSGNDFLRSITYAIEDYKSERDFNKLTWVKTHPGLNNLEMLLADYLIADYTDRSAYQAMSVMGQRVSERPEDYFYSMVGSITTASSTVENGEYLHPAEYFMRLCESKGDFSFIYSTARRSEVKGQNWRPDREKLSAVLPGLIMFGRGETGTREKTHINLDKMFRPISGALSGDGVKAASWFMGPQSAGLSSDDIAAGILKRLRVLGFTGCGEHLEFESGLFFPQSEASFSNDLFVVVSCEINWVTGGPGLLVRSSASGIHEFVDVGAFIGRSSKVGDAICIC